MSNDLYKVTRKFFKTSLTILIMLACSVMPSLAYDNLDGKHTLEINSPVDPILFQYSFDDVTDYTGGSSIIAPRHSAGTILPTFLLFTRYDPWRAAEAKYGANTTVAVLDGAARCSHVYMNRIGGNCTLYLNSDGTYSSYDSHGTHVASTVSLMAPAANIFSYAVFDDNGWVSGSDSSALVHAAANGAKVANMSYGPTEAGILASNDTIKNISKYRKKMLVSKAAGNDGINLKSVKYNINRSNLYKVLNNLIIVGSLQTDGETVSSFSNKPGSGCFGGLKDRGKCKKNNKYMYHFLFAPGEFNAAGPESDTDIEYMTGTSMASPVVAGAAALVQSRWPGLKPAQVKSILFKTADDLGKKGVDKVYGRGRLNVGQALSPINARVVNRYLKRNLNKTIRIKQEKPYFISALTGQNSTKFTFLDSYSRDFNVFSLSRGSGYTNLFSLDLPMTETDTYQLGFAQDLDGQHILVKAVLGPSLTWGKNVNAFDKDHWSTRAVSQSVIDALNESSLLDVSISENIKALYFADTSDELLSGKGLGLEYKLGDKIELFGSYISTSSYFGLQANQSLRSGDNSHDATSVGLLFKEKLNAQLSMKAKFSLLSYINEFQSTALEVDRLNILNAGIVLDQKISEKEHVSYGINVRTIEESDARSVFSGVRKNTDIFDNKVELSMRYALEINHNSRLSFSASTQLNGRSDLGFGLEVAF